MPRQDDQFVQGEGDDRRLSFGAVRVHNGHLQSGRRVTAGCIICVEGLEGALAEVTPPKRPAEVAEGDGADEEEDSALASGGWPRDA